MIIFEFLGFPREFRISLDASNPNHGEQHDFSPDSKV